MHESLTIEKEKTFIETDPWDEGGKFPKGYLSSDIQSAADGFKNEVSFELKDDDMMTKEEILDIFYVWFPTFKK